MNFVESLDLFHVSAKEIPCLTGKGAPTEQTEGAPGVLYMDTDTGSLYKCRGSDNRAFRWEMQGDSANLIGSVHEALAQAKANGEFDGATPVKGVDYYTEADKLEMVAMVLDALGGRVIPGCVDSGKNIVLSNLAAGTYSIGYLMDDGTFVKIADFEVDDNTYYSVSIDLTNCTSSNSAEQVAEGGSYTATITADIGYELESVIVTMGGVDVSATAVSGGTITIAAVDGDIVITAVAKAMAISPSYTNVLPLAVDENGNDYVGTHELGGDGYEYGYRISTSSGAMTADDGIYCSGFIPLNDIYAVVRIANVSLSSIDFKNNIVLYDSNKALVYGAKGTAGAFNVKVTENNGVYSFSAMSWTSSDIAFFRFSCAGISDETIVTINEEIV